jgi:predicted nucleic acid-binding protein
MKRVFADSYYFFALLNASERQHQNAVAFSDSFDGEIVLTSWIVTELGDGLCRGAGRRAFVDLCQNLRANDRVIIVPASDALLTAGIELYSQRQDKEWSLTDCISFIVMQRDGITEALTADHHFEQAGFVRLLQ